MRTRMAAVLASAFLWFLVFVLAGSGAIVLGVRIVFGDGWALVVLGVFLLMSAALVGIGIPDRPKERPRRRAS